MKKYKIPISAEIRYEVTVNAENEDDAMTVACRNYLGPCTIKLEDYGTEYKGVIDALYSDDQLTVLKKYRFTYEFNAANYDEADHDFVWMCADDPDGMIRRLRDSLEEIEDSEGIKNYKVRIKSFVDHKVIVEAENKEDAIAMAERYQDGPCTIKLKNGTTTYEGMIDGAYACNLDDIEIIEKE